MNQDQIKMKPWSELAALEKRAAIALRLGWRQLPKGSLELWYAGSYPANKEGCPFVRYLSPQERLVSAEELPNWPTNDERAFAEVWKKIQNNFIYLAVVTTILHPDKGKPSVHTDAGMSPRWIGPTWADAICHAAYDLLEVPDA